MAIQVNVTINEVKVTNKDIVNQGEYGVNECQFTFSNEYDNLAKRAIFYNNNSSKRNKSNSLNISNFNRT